MPEWMFPELLKPFRVYSKRQERPDDWILDAPNNTDFINWYWMKFLLGALDALCQPDYWQGTPDEQYETAMLFTQWLYETWLP